MKRYLDESVTANELIVLTELHRSVYCATELRRYLLGHWGNHDTIEVLRSQAQARSLGFAIFEVEILRQPDVVTLARSV